jgi:hypothetical protein
MAERQGLTLHRVRRIDPYARDYGLTWLTDDQGTTVASGQLQDVHRYLVRPPEHRR